MARSGAEAELAAVEARLRELRSGVVAHARARLAEGRVDLAAASLDDVEGALRDLEARLQTFRRGPLFG